MPDPHVQWGLRHLVAIRPTQPPRITIGHAAACNQTRTKSGRRGQVLAILVSLKNDVMFGGGKPEL